GSARALTSVWGRPERCMTMSRVVKRSSRMSVGSWILVGYGPRAGVAAVTDVTGWFPRIGRLSALGAGVMGALVATYTAPLVCDTAVPSWHEGYRYMPFVFASSAVSSAGGVGLISAPLVHSAPACSALV